MHSALEVIHRAELTQPNKLDVARQRVFSPDEFIAEVQERATEMLKTRDQVVLLLSGPSGAGKTTITQRIQDLDIDAEAVEVDIDRFFATLRQDRERLMRSEHDWWSTIYDFRVIKDVLRQIEALGENGGKIDLIKTYHVDHFKHDETQDIPEGKKLLVMPGHEFFRTAAYVYDPDDMMRSVLMRKPQQSLEAAIVRDVHDGKAKNDAELAGRINFRRGEFSYQYPVYEDLIHHPDVIHVDNRHLETNWSLVSEEWRERIEKALGNQGLAAVNE